MFKDLKYYMTSILLLCLFSTVRGQAIINGPVHVYSGDQVCYSVNINCGSSAITWSNTIGTNKGNICGLLLPAPAPIVLQTAIQFPTTTSTVLSGTISVAGTCAGSGSLNVLVYPPIGTSAVTPAAQSVVIGTRPTTLTAAIPPGWDGNFTYQWQIPGAHPLQWSGIPGATGRTYTPPTTTLGTQTYRVFITAGGNPLHYTFTSATVTVVNPPVTAGVLTPSGLTLGAGTSPGVLTMTKAAGGGCNGSYVYKWQSSLNGTTWTDVTSASDYAYNPGNLSTTTSYRVRVICGTDTTYTAVSKMTIGSVVTDWNYTRERDIRKAGVTTLTAAAALTDVRDVTQTTNYFDGIGRPVQSVARQASPSQHDMVTMQVYDPIGRQAVKYLAYTSPSGDGNYKTNPWGEQSNFNATQFPNDQFYYTLTKFDSSPLSRPQTTFPQGNSWVLAGKNESTQFLVSTAADSVYAWNIDLPAGSVPVTAGLYPAGALYKTVISDEEGHQQIEYKDVDGHTLLKKAQLWAAPATGPSGWLCTYYVYDDLNNLRFVIQPRAVEWLQGNSWSFAGAAGVVNELCFRYEYDLRRHMIVKKVPGMEEVRMVYDVRDRLVMSQDSLLRSQKKWEVYCYDALNRQDTVALMTDVSHYNDLSWHVTQALTQPFYPFTAGFPTEVVTQFYYDSYDWVTALGSALTATMNTTYNNDPAYFFTAFNTYPYATPLAQAPLARGLSTGYRSKIIDTTQFLYYVPYYDDRGRVIGAQTSNYSNGLDQDWTQFDFSGKPLRSLLSHKKNPPNTQAHLITSKYVYDGIGRLLSTRKVMDGVEARVDTMMYSELGQLRAKYFAGDLDSMVYDYNIRGWTTGINKKYLTGAASNYFGMELGYESSPSGIAGYTRPAYNGNIAGMVWKSAGDGVARKYDFTYDNVNRLTAADFTQYNGTSFASSATIDFGVPKISYDANGNILSMIQKGFKIGGSVPIDRLSYGYFANSNRLKYVYDTANDVNSLLGDLHYNPSGKDTLNTPDYAYDANGNLISDKNKGIRSIQYNFLHMPAKISFLKPDGSSKGNIVYKYDAMGTKWAKIVTDSSVTPVKVTTTLYIKGVQYINDTIQFVAHEEGRARYFWQHYMNGDSSFRTRFDYFERDHLGNTRVILTDQRDTLKYVATMEAAYRTKENKLFYNIPATAFARTAASGYPVDTATTNPNDSVTRLGNNGQKVGAAIILKVMSGDKVTIGTNYYFNTGGTTGSQQLTAQDLINSLASGIVTLTGGAHGSFGDLTGASTPLTGAINNFVSGNNTSSTGKPNAYLNWILLDNQFAYVGTSGQSGALPVATAGTTGGKLQAPLGTTINLKTSGYLYIYVSNASPTWDVFFDNLSVMHYAGPMVEENHYYPFGLSMAGLSDKALKGWYPENKNRFNGGNELQNKELSDGSGLELYDAVHRLYDPQIGRFWQIDEFGEITNNWSPYAFSVNNPTGYNDPLGLDSLTRKTNLDPVVVRGHHTKKNLEHTYWYYINHNMSFDQIQDKGVRNWMYRYDNLQKYLERLHSMIREQGLAVIEYGSWLIPIGPELKLGASALRLFKLRRGLGVLGKVAKKYGWEAAKNLSAEYIKNRGDWRNMDIHDIITSTIASKYGILVRAGVEMYNATTDVSVGGVKAVYLNGDYSKSGSDVFLDVMFGYMKLTGDAIGEGTGASEASKKLFSTIMDQGQKTITDVRDNK